MSSLALIISIYLHFVGLGFGDTNVVLCHLLSQITVIFCSCILEDSFLQCSKQFVYFGLLDISHLLLIELN